MYPREDCPGTPRLIESNSGGIHELITYTVDPTISPFVLSTSRYEPCLLMNEAVVPHLYYSE